MAVGLMMLPAAVAQLWARTLPVMILVAVATAMFSGFVGLIVSYHLRFASGPAIILTASLVYGGSLLFNPL
jgi:zinc/manganese transport system permease protein